MIGTQRLCRGLPLFLLGLWLIFAHPAAPAERASGSRDYASFTEFLLSNLTWEMTDGSPNDAVIRQVSPVNIRFLAEETTANIGKAVGWTLGQFEHEFALRYVLAKGDGEIIYNLMLVHSDLEVFSRIIEMLKSRFEEVSHQRTMDQIAETHCKSFFGPTVKTHGSIGVILIESIGDDRLETVCLLEGMVRTHGLPIPMTDFERLRAQDSSGRRPLRDGDSLADWLHPADILALKILHDPAVEDDMPVEAVEPLIPILLRKHCPGRTCPGVAAFEAQ